MLAQFLARSIECHCRQCTLYKLANTPSTLQEPKLGTLLNLPNLAQQWLEKRMLALMNDMFTKCKMVCMSIGTLLVVQIYFAN